MAANVQTTAFHSNNLNENVLRTNPSHLYFHSEQFHFHQNPLSYDQLADSQQEINNPSLPAPVDYNNGNSQSNSSFDPSDRESIDCQSNYSIKLNKNVSSLLKINLVAMLVISLFMKVTVLTVINGSLNLFLVFKIFLHGAILLFFVRSSFLWLQFCWVLDLLLFVVFVLFELIFLMCRFFDLITEPKSTVKRNKNLGLVGVWLLLLITAIDLTVLIMSAIVVYKRRKPQTLYECDDWQQNLSRTGTGSVRTTSGQCVRYSKVICKSGSYLLGFACHNLDSLVSLVQSTNESSSNRLGSLLPQLETSNQPIQSYQPSIPAIDNEAENDANEPIQEQTSQSMNDLEAVFQQDTTSAHPYHFQYQVINKQTDDQ